MFDFDETKDYPPQKPVRQPPPGPPAWIEGPQIPPEILKGLREHREDNQEIPRLHREGPEREEKQEPTLRMGTVAFSL
ncbi:MAG TPA: hypothetical protein VGL94_17850 [Ktedonobacteraceae bacterium]|jgi:hypothetical protein